MITWFSKYRKVSEIFKQCIKQIDRNTNNAIKSELKNVHHCSELYSKKNVLIQTRLASVRANGGLDTGTGGLPLIVPVP